METIKATTHADPTYLVDGVVHYGVANMPGAVPRTSTYALCNQTLPYAMKLAHKGVDALREDYAAGLDDEGRELLDDISGLADRAADIVRNLLDFSRIERPPLVPLDPAEVATTSASLVKNQMQVAGIAFSLEAPAGLPLIRGDLRSLQQVLVNILLNAAQATPRGGRVRLEVASGADGGTCFTVADTGPGVPPDVLHHIFEPFYTTKGVGKGTGLGLAVAYSLTKHHGGCIEVDNPADGGAAFTICLPPVPTAGDPTRPDQELQP